MVSHSARVSNLSGFAVGGHPCLIGHLVGAHLQSNGVASFTHLLLTEFPGGSLCRLGTNDRASETIGLRLPAQGEQARNDLGGGYAVRERERLL